MSENTKVESTREYSIIYALSELEPHTVDALVEVLTRLAQLIELQCHESLGQAYEEDAHQAARDQLPLDLFDDSDIGRRDTEHLPF